MYNHVFLMQDEERLRKLLGVARPAVLPDLERSVDLSVHACLVGVDYIDCCTL